MSAFFAWLALAAIAMLLVFLATRLLESFVLRVTVKEHERGLLYRSGRLVRELGPGAWWRLPGRAITVLDMRSRVTTVPGQEILTADQVSIRVSLLLRWHIADARAAVTTSQSYEEALYADAQLALRDRVSATSLEQLLEQRMAIAAGLQERLAPLAAARGLALEEIGIKDVTFPPQLRQVFQQVVEAKQAALASLERSRGELASLRSLANAARMLEGNPGLLALKTLQAAGAGGNTLVLGMPGGVLPVPAGPPPTPPATGDAAT